VLVVGGGVRGSKDIGNVRSTETHVAVNKHLLLLNEIRGCEKKTILFYLPSLFSHYFVGGTRGGQQTPWPPPT